MHYMITDDYTIPGSHHFSQKKKKKERKKERKRII